MRGPPRWTPVEGDLRDAVASVVEALLPTRRAQRHSRSDSTLPSAPATAEFDPRRVDRILRNLLANAIEHSDGQPIDVRSASSDEAVAVVVRDHGTGLAAG